jgi:dTDP-glucose pyrophosphorylase
MLNSEDNLCLTPFDDKPVIELPIQGMNQAGKDKALAVLEKLEPMYSTNIWSALKASID